MIRTWGRSLLAAAITVAAAAAGVVVGPATPAAAITYCDASIVWQDAYVPGDSYTLRPYCMTRQGAGPNNAVQTLQDTLVTCYHKNIAVDRLFGTQTRRALEEVQRSLDIPDDGIYGPQTARAMSHRIVGGGGRCKRITF